MIKKESIFMYMATFVFCSFVAFSFYVKDDSKGVEFLNDTGSWTKYDYFCSECFIDNSLHTQNIRNGLIEIKRGSFKRRIDGISWFLEGETPNAVYYKFPPPQGQ